MTIYYVYRKDNGEFAGSGTPLIENETHSSTTIATPEYDSETQKAIFNGIKWEVIEHEPIL